MYLNILIYYGIVIEKERRYASKIHVYGNNI